MSNITDALAISHVEIIAAESPGPGGRIDPRREIKDPKPGSLYVLWERRSDYSVGNVAVVYTEPHETIPGAVVLKLQHGPTVAALGSLLIEHAFREAASESRIAALEARLDRLESSLMSPGESN